MACGANLYALPEECFAGILSLTTPPDACRLSLVSKIFRSAADSDAVWEKFLPSDYQSIIARSDGSSPVAIPFKKKELYFRLCESPLLIDEGKKSFSLDKSSGKKCYIIAERGLTYVVAHGVNALPSTRQISLSQSRFREVDEFCRVLLFRISGKINTGMLSLETTYAAYLVCKFSSGAFGFDNTTAYISVGMAGDESCKGTVYLDPNAGHIQEDWIVERYVGQFKGIPIYMMESQPSTTGESSDQFPKERGDDGWLEMNVDPLLVLFSACICYFA